MSSTTQSNSKPKKTLSDQLDRLDSIIDVLGEGINETVTDAVRQAVTVAVREALQALVREALTNPELLRQLAALAAPHLPQQAPPAPAVAEAQPQAAPSQEPVQPARPGCRALLAGAAVAACEQLRPAARTAGRRCRRWLSVAWAGLAALGRWARRHPSATLAAVAVGVAVGWAAYQAGPAVSSALLGLVGAAASLASSALAPLFRLFRASPPPSPAP